jgi:hypothetical protein
MRQNRNWAFGCAEKASGGYDLHCHLDSSRAVAALSGVAIYGITSSVANSIPQRRVWGSTQPSTITRNINL